MKVTIIGAGNMGRGIGTRALAGGHDVEILDRDPAEAHALADALGQAATGGATATAIEAGSSFGGDLVVLALYYGPEQEAVEQYRNELAGKVVVEISNPVDPETFDRLITPPDSSAAEEIAKMLPEARVVKAFNTTFATTLVAGEVAGQPLDVFIAGDDEDAKAKVRELVESGGLRAIDTGALASARHAEHAGFLQMSVQETIGTGYASALKILS